MTLSFDDAAAATPSVSTANSLDAWVLSLPEDEQAKVLAALRDADNWSGERLAYIFTAMGRKFSRSYVNEWRRARGIRRSR